MEGLDFVEKILNTERCLEEKNVLLIIFWHILLPSFSMLLVVFRLLVSLQLFIEKEGWKDF